MFGSDGYYFFAALVMLLLIGAYWAQPSRRALLANRRNAVALVALVASGIGFCLWSVSLERGDNTFERLAQPVAIAVAFDLSPSMQAVPNPEIDGEYPPRFERGKAALLDFFRGLEEDRQPVIVSVLGFTRDAEIIMGWDQNLSQVREILQYAVAPDLFASSGTSIEAAAKSLTDAFAMLPDDIREGSRRIAVIVSDGEDTMRASSFDYAKTMISEATFDTIALQTGLLDKSEGLPVYGSVGEFEGFRSMRGEFFTVPDVAAMTALTEASSGRGLYVRAETDDSVPRMLEFAIADGLGARAIDATWLSTFGMFAVVSMLCVAIIR